MSGGRFLALLAGLLGVAFVLVWVLVSVAALVYALTNEDGGSAGTYAGLAVAGLAVGALAGWGVRRVARARRPPR
ncbi:hypothetical protein N798_06275 [Knoellia flava TL1]|uniref:Uncharacterized protein n=2 Tax=Knoellia flava TaxID=913969 RepID=A0A8H9FQY1_9MICO|nr:hypothetical protein [Knoellia flava]KGN33622.1 hypothetical protein N798_06275 [Knoellia flava TL1]GGB73082.1 hypothetical protein GCM10011314_10760 [Knoellia flava]